MAGAAGTDGGSAGGPGRGDLALAVLLPLLALVLGHVLSNALRTLPAVASDLLRADLGVGADGLARLTGSYHLAFALAQVPVGVALDRFGVRRTALALGGVVLCGTVLAASVGGPGGFLVAQMVLGAGCAGALIAPMTFAARLLTPARFGLWSGLIQGIGNAGMLLSASPLAALADAAGWRAGYWAAGGLALLSLAAVALLVRGPAAGPAVAAGPAGRPGGMAAERPPGMAANAVAVLRLLVSRELRPMVVLAFASFAAVIGVRGLWGGPWLMEAKGLTRIGAGEVLTLATLALVAGPVLAGVLDRRTGRRRALLFWGHALAAALLLLLPLGRALPAWWDAAVLFAAFAAISVQPLIFALVRAEVPPERAGRALSAVNLSFFAGAAALQSASGPVGDAFGPGAALGFLALAVAGCALGFRLMSPPAPRPGSVVEPVLGSVERAVE